MRYLSEEDRELASRFLFLSMAILVIEKDIHTIEQGSFKIKEPYMELLRKMAHKAKSERRYLRGLMKSRQLDVMLLSKNESFSSYLFVSGGHEEKRNYFNPAIRKHVETIMYELMRKVLQPSQGKLASSGMEDSP